MPGQIPEEFINDLRHRADIVSIVGEFIPLKKQGRNYIGMCPFHSEKTPSFVVSPEKQIYHCFGCGKGGNVFSFLMDKNTMTFPETIESLAKKYGLILPQTDLSPEKAKEEFLRKRYYHTNDLTAEYYQRLLHEPIGREALHYLLGRAITKNTMERFVLGYATSRWDGLVEYLQQQGITEQEMLVAGVAVKTHKDTLIDRFRNRIIYPIKDDGGRIIGFGGRVMDEGQPKYLNSPDTPLFSKGRHLYGLNLAKGSIREKDSVIIMEGYMDVITSWQNGVTNVVGTLGTALTPEQVRLLMRYTYNTNICFDADAAGEKASLRGLDILQEQGCNVLVVTIPGVKDPDDFVRKEGGARFAEVVRNAQTLFEYKLVKHMDQNNIHSIPGRIKVVQEMIPDIVKTKSPIARQADLQMLAERLDFPESAIHAEIRKAMSDQKKPVVTAVAKISTLSALDRAQRTILRTIVEFPELTDEVEKLGGKDLFSDSLLKSIYNIYRAVLQDGHVVKADSLISLIDDRPAQEILTAIFLEDELLEDSSRIYRDCLLLLKADWIQQQINAKNIQMSEMEKKGEATKALELMVKIQQLLKEKHNPSMTLGKGGENFED